MTRDEFVARVSDILRRSNVDDADNLIDLLVGHIKEEFPPGCGQFTNAALQQRTDPHWRERGDPSSYGICVLPEGHEGYHKDADGYGWITF